MINKIIVQYLDANKRLVIPEFGAFIRKDAGETVFVEFLKKDDQVFSGLIRKAYGVDESEARLITEQFVAEIKKSIARSGAYVIENLGTLKKDGNGVYELHYDPTVQLAANYAPEQEQAAVSSHQPAVAPAAAGDIADTPQPAAGTASAVTSGVKEVPVRPVVRQAAATQEKEITSATQRNYAGIYNDDPVRSKPEPAVYGRPIAEEIPSPKPVYNNRRPSPAPQAGTKGKTDMVMIIAIIAAVIAIASIVFGIMVDSDPIMNIQPTQQEQLNVFGDGENPASEEQADE